MKRTSGLMSLTLCVFMVLSLLTVPAGAKGLKDISGHWAEDYIKSAVSKGYVNGYEDGTFRPNNRITRAEFCKLLNSALGLTATTAIDFPDVTSAKWYRGDVQKAVAAGYIAGYDDGNFRGDNNISRQEAAVVITRIVTGSHSTKDISVLRDYKSIAPWAMDGAKTVFSKGYMTGDNNKKFNPSGSLTRGEAVKIIESLLKKETIVRNNLTVKAAGKTYSDSIYVGSVIIDEAVDTGSVTFNNCRILGTMLINGGGTSGIRLASTRVSNMTVNNPRTVTGVACAGASTVSNVYVSTPCAMTEASLTGSGEGFKNVTLGGSELRRGTVTMAGNFDSITVSTNTNVDIVSGHVKELTVNSSAATSVIELGSSVTVDKTEINGSCSFKGKGTIKTAVQNAEDVNYETEPEKITGSVVVPPSKELKITSDPADGETRVPADGFIEIKFSEAVKNADGEPLTSAYVQNSAIEIRRGSTSGTKVSYYCEFASSGKSVTVIPLAELQEDSQYFITVKSGAFRTASGVYNKAFSASFSTGGAASGKLIPQVTPADGSKQVPVSTDIKLRFGDKLFTKNGSSLTSDYAKSYVLDLRKGSSSGTKIAFTASVSSDRKTLTMTPSKELTPDTEYYVLLNGQSLSDYEGRLNSARYWSFRTASTEYLVPVADPASGAGDIDTTGDFIFTFPSAMYNPSGSALTPSYLRTKAFSMHRGSVNGPSVSFSASVSSDKRTITLTPDDELRQGEDYYIIISGGSMIDRYFDKVSELVYSYTTGSSSQSGWLEPHITYPENGSTGIERNCEIYIAYSNGLRTSEGRTVTPSYIENTAVTVRRGSSSGTKVGFSASISSSGKEISIMPVGSLDRNTKYYVTVNQGVFKNSSGVKNAKYTFSFTVGSSAYTMEDPYETVPADRAVKVSSGSDIKIYFSQGIYEADGSDISSAYLKNTAFEIRRSSPSGPYVSFKGSVSSSRRTVTLSPSQFLDEGYEYYVILNEDTLSDSEGNRNREYVFSFTVGSSSSPLPQSVYPALGASNVPVNTQISISFADRMYRSASGSALTASHVANNVQLRRSVNSSSAEKVPFTASVSSSGKTVTITPIRSLAEDTRYYIYIPGYTFYTYSGDVNASADSYFFTTQAGTAMAAPSMTPSDGEKGVRAGQDTVTLRYGDSLMTSDGSGLSASYIESSLKVTKNSPSGASVPFKASVSSSRNITLTLKEPFAYDTVYCVSAPSGVFKTASGAVSGSLSYSFETEKPTLKITAEPSKKTAVLTVEYDFEGASEASLRITCGSQTIADSFVPKNRRGSFTMDVDGLTEGTSYSASVILTYDGGKKITETCAFRTEATSKDSTLSSLTVEDSMGSFGASLETPRDGRAKATVTGELSPYEGQITVKAQASDPKSVIEIDGVQGGERKISAGSEPEKTVEIRVTAEDGSSTLYTLTVHIKAD